MHCSADKSWTRWPLCIRAASAPSQACGRRRVHTQAAAAFIRHPSSFEKKSHSKVFSPCRMTNMQVTGARQRRWMPVEGQPRAILNLKGRITFLDKNFQGNGGSDFGESVRGGGEEERRGEGRVFFPFFLWEGCLESFFAGTGKLVQFSTLSKRWHCYHSSHAQLPPGREGAPAPPARPRTRPRLRLPRGGGGGSLPSGTRQTQPRFVPQGPVSRAVAAGPLAALSVPGCHPSRQKGSSETDSVRAVPGSPEIQFRVFLEELRVLK